MHASSCPQTRRPGTFSRLHAAQGVRRAGSDCEDPLAGFGASEVSGAQGKPRPSWGRAPERNPHSLNDALSPLPLPLPQRLEPLTLCKKNGFPPGWGNTLPHSIPSFRTPVQRASSHRGQNHPESEKTNDVKEGAKLNTKTEISL